MGKLSSYSLSDFILFTESAYYRQFELYNQAIWPLHLLAIVFTLVIIYTLWKKPAWAGRVVSAILFASWLWVAWAFLYERFYQLHVVANWYALGFLLEAVLLGWYGVIKNRLALYTSNQFRIVTGSVVLSVALFFYPFIALLSGRSALQFEMFALAPDPTALATLAVLFFYKGSKVFLVIPLLWVLLSGVTLYGIS